MRIVVNDELLFDRFEHEIDQAGVRGKLEFENDRVKR